MLTNNCSVYIHTGLLGKLSVALFDGLCLYYFAV